MDKIKKSLIILALGLLLSQSVCSQGIFFMPYIIIKMYGAKNMTDEEMAEKVRVLIEYEDSQHEICDRSSPYTLRLQRLTKNIQPDNCLPLNFKVYYDEETVNAFSAPDGSIRVFSALMDMLNDDELYGVLAHEVGHIAKRHARDNYIKSIKLSALEIDPIISRMFLYRISNSFLEAHYSQEQEKDADIYACKFMISHGVPPCALIEGFDVMWRFFRENEPNYRDGGILSTHPGFEDRIAYLSSMLRQEGFTCY